MVAASPRECRSRAPNVCAAAEGPPFRKGGTALESPGTPPSYAFDDTRLLHSAIFAQFIVRKGLTGVFALMIPGCAEGADPDSRSHRIGIPGSRCRAPRNDG